MRHIFDTHRLATHQLPRLSSSPIPKQLSPPIRSVADLSLLYQDSQVQQPEPQWLPSFGSGPEASAAHGSMRAGFRLFFPHKPLPRAYF